MCWQHPFLSTRGTHVTPPKHAPCRAAVSTDSWDFVFNVWVRFKIINLNNLLALVMGGCGEASHPLLVRLMVWWLFWSDLKFHLMYLCRDGMITCGNTARDHSTSTIRKCVCVWKERCSVCEWANVSSNVKCAWQWHWLKTHNFWIFSNKFMIISVLAD